MKLPLLCVALATLVAVPASAQPCWRLPPVSPVGAAAHDALLAWDSRGGPPGLSAASFCNQLEDANGTPWLIRIPGDMSREAFHALIAGDIRATQSRIILSLPELGEAEALLYGQAILELHQRRVAEQAALPVIVRILARPVSPTAANNLLLPLLQAVPKGVSWKVLVALRDVGSHDWLGTAWNHSTSLARDNIVAMAGGVGPEGQQLAMRLTGEAALRTDSALDALWNLGFRSGFESTCWMSSNLEQACASPLPGVDACAPASCWQSKVAPLPDYRVPGSRLVLSLARGDLGERGQDGSADEALLAAIGASEQSVYLSQPQLDLFIPRRFIDGYVPRVFEALADAAIRTTEGVRILVSPGGGLSRTPAEQWNQLAAYADVHFRKRGLTDAERFTAHCKLQMAPQLTPVGSATHERLVLMDQGAFYLGSQGLHPSAVADPAAGEYLELAQLFEHGFLVDGVPGNPDAARVHDTFWSPAWERSKAGIFPNPFVPAGYSCSAACELVSNGDFSQGDVGFTSEYSSQHNSGGSYHIGANPTVYNGNWSGTDHTTGAGLFLIANGAETLDTDVWCQSVPVVPGQSYVFSLWASNIVVPGEPPDPVLQLSINGVDVEGCSIQPLESPDDQQWRQLTCGWSPGSATQARLCVRSEVTHYSGNDFGLDDLSFHPASCTPPTR